MHVPPSGSSRDDHWEQQPAHVAHFFRRRRPQSHLNYPGRDLSVRKAILYRGTRAGINAPVHILWTLSAFRPSLHGTPPHARVSEVLHGAETSRRLRNGGGN